MAGLTLLKALLTERHMQTHAAFCREYSAAARRIDASLAVTAPGREQFQRWLSGRVRTKPHPDHCRVLERMFPGRTVEELLAPCQPPNPSPPAEEVSPTNRRELLQASGTTVASLLFDILWSEPDLMQSALDTTTVSPSRLKALQREAADMGVRVVRVPPSTLLEEALMNFKGVRRLISEKQTLSVQRELVRCAAMFATVVGEICFNEGQSALARHWYKTARHAAQEAKDQYLADIALAGSTYLPTYAPDPRAVLENVDPRLYANAGASPAIAWLWGFKAKAHAMLGDRYSFEQAVDNANHILDASPADLIQPGIFSFVPEKLAFYEARGRVDLGETDRAYEAAERAISLYDPIETTEPALARFEHASALVQAGEVPEACRVATAALLDRHTYHSITVVKRAAEFDGLLGPSAGDAVRGWREVLTSLRRPRLAVTSSGDAE